MGDSKLVDLMHKDGFMCPLAGHLMGVTAETLVEKYNITDGWFRTMDDLPIVWVGTFEKELNPAFLEREYERIMMNFDRYKFEKLTMLYWKSFVESFLPSSNLPK